MHRLSDGWKSEVLWTLRGAECIVVGIGNRASNGWSDHDGHTQRGKLGLFRRLWLYPIGGTKSLAFTWGVGCFLASFCDDSMLCSSRGVDM